jgi:hypothetical protein
VIDFKILWAVYRALQPSPAMDQACRDSCTSLYFVDESSIQVIRIGEQIEEKWNIKIEYSGNANDDLDIVD